MLRSSSYYPNIDRDVVVKALGECGRVELDEFSQEATCPNIIRVHLRATVEAVAVARGR